MELASKVVDAASKAAKSNVVVNSFLGATFVALSIRSMNQQRDIEALEAQKDSLVKSNKAVKKTIWDWKQQLYADASVENAVVPLAKLKAIYGEAPALQSGGDGDKADGRSPSRKILI